MRDKLASLEQRRQFITGLFKSSLALGCLPLWGALQGCDRPSTESSLLQTEPWKTFASVQQQLFPDDGNGPSARDINASLYLKFVLAAPDTDADDRNFLLNGIKWLDDLSKAQFSSAFTELKPLEQDRVLQKIATSQAGERWLSQLLLYLFEALLTAPAYGGNPDGIGWQWLAHQAGFPLPGQDKLYTKLR